MNRCVHTSLLVVLIAGSAHAQVTMQRAGSTSAATPCTLADKIQIASFTAPAESDTRYSFSVTVKIKNNCPSGSANQSVDWKIVSSPSNTAVASGNASIAPGAVFTGYKTYVTPGPGVYSFYPDVRTGSEIDTLPDIRVTVWRKAIIGHDEAKNAGAEFMNTLTSGSCTTSIKGMADSETSDRRHVVASLDCRQSTAAGTSEVEVFKNFTLRNGWLVLDTRVVSRNEGYWMGVTTFGTFQPMITAANMTARPFSKIRLSAPAGAVSSIQVTVKGGSTSLIGSPY